MSRRKPNGEWIGHPGIVHYASLVEYRRALAEKVPEESTTRGSEGSSQGESWDLGVEWHEAETLAREGWSKGAARVRALAEKIRDALEPPESLAPSYDVAPFGPDVNLDMGRFVDGDPEHWRVNVPRRGGKVTVCVSVNALASVYADSMERRGAVGLAIAWVLHDAGYEVDLRGMKVNSDTSAHGANRAVGPTWSMPMEPALAAYWLAHPASMRRQGFRWLEINAPWCALDGYGKTNIAYEKRAVPAGAIHIQGLTSDDGWETDEAATATARRLLSTLDTSTIHS